MKHDISKSVLYSILAVTCLVGCTNSGSSTSLAGNITDTVKDILNPDSSAGVAEKQVFEIQKDLNKDNTYALTQEDVAFLKAEGLQVNENEIKAWVK